MFFETYDGALEPRQFHLFLGLALGLAFGVAAQISRFCLRRAVAGDPGERNSAAGVWVAALATAVLGVQALSLSGFVDLAGHRWSSADLPIVALVIGGLAFGAGMALTRGCISRLTVLGASGNLRALTVILVFAVVAHATIKGVLAPLRVALGSVTLPAPVASLAELPGGPGVWAAIVALPLLILAARSGARYRDMILGAVIGLVAVAGWAATSVLLFDEFDPLPVQSVAFTLPWSETLFWSIAGTAVPAGFGTGFVGGVLAGAFVSAAARRELQAASFETPAQTVRYVSGAALMGTGGVLAGGCTVGAGLAGVSTLSVAAIVALVSIIAGAKVASLVLDGRRAAVALTPAE